MAKEKTEVNTNTLCFRKLRADEIECRVGVSKEHGCSILLYKDARVDQNILDETVGPYNWQRHHSRDNANCIVSIWDESKKQWIDKEDVGTESNTEAQKGLASDSFKRACFNWGIGRELYTAPFIWIPSSKYEVIKRNDKFYPDASFKVTKIFYDEKGNINGLKIIDEKSEGEDKTVYAYYTPELIEKLRSEQNKKQKIIQTLKSQES